MTWNLRAHTSSGGSGSATNTTSAINTTGADLIVVFLAYNLGSTVTLSDSLGNSWTGITSISDGVTVTAIMYYCHAPTVGAAHTFSVSGSNNYCSMFVEAWSGSASSGTLDQQGTTFSSSNVLSLLSTSITPAVAGELIVTGIAWGASSEASVTVNDGLTQPDAALVTGSGNYYSSGAAYLVQSVAAAIAPTWSWASPSSSCATIIVSFEPGAGGTVVTSDGVTYAELLAALRKDGYPQLESQSAAGVSRDSIPQVESLSGARRDD